MLLEAVEGAEVADPGPRLGAIGGQGDDPLEAGAADRGSDGVTGPVLLGVRVTAGGVGGRVQREQPAVLRQHRPQRLGVVDVDDGRTADVLESRNHSAGSSTGLASTGMPVETFVVVAAGLFLLGALLVGTTRLRRRS